MSALSLRAVSGGVRGGALPAAILLLVLLMVVPVPPSLLDVFFILNIMVSLAVLMVALNAEKPLDFSSFPTVLLFTTLFRLALNVASTRVVLVHGHEGTSAAGHVIEAFGNFLIGGDYVVGIFVFAIFIVINLIVVTKGAGRVSEVSARFTLDALPGKQMAIDADLNAGLMTPAEAKARRIEVSTEADFYGAMDGSSKFVKGDAIAALIILVINVVGGLILGTVHHGLTLSEAATNYVLLAIGDALVAQIPALMLSIAAAAIVTRVSSTFDLAGQIGSQFASPKAWVPVAAILGILGLLPGMPHLVILPAAAVAAYLAWKLRKQPQVEDVVSALAVTETPRDLTQIDWEEVSDHIQVGIEIGYGLVPLVDDRLGAPLMGRITGIRRQLSKELGFVVPLVRVRDNISLAPYSYRIIIGGVIVGEDQASADDLLALDSGQVVGRIEGRAARDPTFGLDALWIAPADRDAATAAGYMVVDASTVLATHLNHLLTQNSDQLLGPDEVQKLLDGLKDSSAQLVNALQPLQLTTITQVLRQLLSEGVGLKDFRRIAGALAMACQRTQDADELVEAIRPELGPLIIQKLCGVHEPLRVVTLDGGLESLLGQAVRSDTSGRNAIEPELGQRLMQALGQAAQPLIERAEPFVLVVQPIIRRAMRKLLKTALPDVPVMSFFEVPDGKAVEVVAVIGSPEPAAA